MNSRRYTIDENLRKEVGHRWRGLLDALMAGYYSRKLKLGK